LVRACKAGGAVGRAALERLLTRHERQLYATCRRMVRDHETARDLAQDTLVRVIGAIDSFDGRARFTTWMTQIAINVCISYLRKQKHRRGPSLDSAIGDGDPPRNRLESTEPPPARRVELDDDLNRVDRAMQALSGEQRAILVLRDVRGFEYREIAEALHLPVGTVKSRLFRARQALREEVEALERPHPSAPAGRRHEHR